MPPVRPQILTDLSQSINRLYNTKHGVAFHTSVPRWPRVRPRARPRIHEDGPETSLHGADGERQTLNFQKAAARNNHQDPELDGRHVREQNNEPKVATATIATSPAPAPPTPASHRIQSKRFAPPGMKPHKQSLFTSNLIYQGADSPTLITNTTKAEHQQILSAGEFFANESRFLYSAETLYHHPKNVHVPEIVVLGASNVGKSSFLNALVGKDDAARVSARPGKTTLMNAFGVGPMPKIPKGLVKQGEKMPRHSLVIMDTPGYGFRSQVKWGDTILKYLQLRKTLRGAVVLLSSEKKLMDQDLWVLRSLAEANTRTMVVLTKADKAEGSWEQHCSGMAQLVRAKLRDLERATGNRWKEGAGWTTDVYITAAGMDRIPKLGSGGGIGGVRAAILKMAGFKLEDKEVKKQDETVTYGGPVVSFDDIKWKT